MCIVIVMNFKRSMLGLGSMRMFHTTDASGSFTIDYIPFKTKHFSHIIVEMNNFTLSRRANVNSPPVLLNS